ncbi:MAG TPA: M15 family metallopeptidase [Microvirga sp.]|nr:M15 family metallopeptidase [Microvirga sp.]
MRSLGLGLVIVAWGLVPRALAQETFAAAGSARVAAAAGGALYGPGDVYANIPPEDEFGRDQIAMFREWNPDPVGNHDSNLEALNPSLARVVRKAQADNPTLRFVIGSGRRDMRLQTKAVAWGWSRTRDSRHRTGNAVDLWPLDHQGRISFDRTAQARIGAAMRKAAAELSVPIRWGGNFSKFKDRDRSHFELVSH